MDICQYILYGGGNRNPHQKIKQYLDLLEFGNCTLGKMKMSHETKSKEVYRVLASNTIYLPISLLD